MNRKKLEKICSVILSIVGIILVIDTILEQFFNIGTKQQSFIFGYCIAFVLLSIKFPNILKRKYVVYPLYIMVAQTIYSLMNKYF